MNYKQTVAEIRNLRWERLNAGELQQLMVLSGYAAREFAESLRIARRLHPDNAQLEEMAAGELQTDNLRFNDYARRGDHADFLWQFIDRYGIMKSEEQVSAVGEAYLDRVRTLDDQTRVMSIASREQELPGIFSRILSASDWNASGLLEFRYYLKQHILFDTGIGGHGELTRDIPIDDRVDAFYQHRLEMYRVISKLFR